MASNRLSQASAAVTASQLQCGRPSARSSSKSPAVTATASREDALARALTARTAGCRINARNSPRPCRRSCRRSAW